MPTLANEQEGWIRHDGRELGLYGIPTALGACLVDLELRNGCKKYAQNSETVTWKWASPSSSYQGFDVVAYRVCKEPEEEMKKEVEYQIPEGYIRSHGKKPDLPADTLVTVTPIGDFNQDGSRRRDPWGEPEKISFYDFDHTLIAYKVVSSEAKTGEIAEASSNTNPKQAYGDSKLPVGLVSPIFVANVCLAKLNGKLKYGGANYIGTQVVLSTYLHAIQRHLFAFSLGEEFDLVDGVPHLGAIGASIDIILSAKAAGTLIDDRLRCDGQLEAIQALLPIVASLKELHKDKNPKHYLMTEK